MTYVGRGVDAISNVEKLDNITFDGSTTYNLTKSSVAFTPSGANNILISIDGVVQQNNFSVAGATIIFDFSPTSANTCNFIMHYGVGLINTLGDQTITSANMGANSVDSDSYVDGSIDAVHLSANSVDSDSYVDASIDTAHIGATQVTGAKLNNDVISAQTALASEPADTDEFMVSDGGVLKRIDYSLIKSAGIDGVQVWNMTTAFQGAGAPNWGDIIANWSSSAPTNGQGTPLVGTAPVTQSSGIFTFTSTGFYLIKFTCSFADNSGADKDVFANIKLTKNNSTYNNCARAGQSLTEASVGRSATATTLLDITDTSNQKVMFAAGGIETSTYCYGHGDYQHTYALFWRLGDT